VLLKFIHGENDSYASAKLLANIASATRIAVVTMSLITIFKAVKMNFGGKFWAWISPHTDKLKS